MKFFKAVIFDVLIAFLVFIVVNFLFLDQFVVKGNSMVPSIFPKERILVLRFPLKKISRCDVVVFLYPNDPKKTFVKRIAALPGEYLEIKDGKIFINGHLEEAPCIKVPSSLSLSRKIPEGFYFVLGDNPEVSNDSRYGWLVPSEFIKGKAIAIYWPISDMRLIK